MARCFNVHMSGTLPVWVRNKSLQLMPLMPGKESGICWMQTQCQGRVQGTQAPSCYDMFWVE
jgi:hypothetical protein